MTRRRRSKPAPLKPINVKLLPDQLAAIEDHLLTLDPPPVRSAWIRDALMEACGRADLIEDIRAGRPREE